MLLNLLTETDTPETPWGSYLFMGIVVALIVVFMVLKIKFSVLRNLQGDWFPWK